MKRSAEGARWRSGGPEKARHTVRLVFRVPEGVRTALERLQRITSAESLSDAAAEAILDRLDELEREATAAS